MAMDWDDILKPKVVKTVTVGEDLKTLSVAELDERIGVLKEEIARVEAEKTAKVKHEAAATALFKR